MARSKRSPLTPGQQELARRYIPLAKTMAKPLKLSWPNAAEEFDSAALLALVEAAQSFDPGRNVRFGTFARYRIWGALRDVQRGFVEAENATVVSFNPEMEREGVVMFATPDPEVGTRLAEEDAVEALTRPLLARERGLLRLLYVEGLDQSQAAERLGLSKSRVSYVHAEALRGLRGVC